MTDSVEILLKMVHLRCQDGILERGPKGPAGPEWLCVIWEANRIMNEQGLPPIFGKPEYLGEWWAGGGVEEYEDARVLLRGDGTVSIVSKTEHGASVLRDTAHNLGIPSEPLVSQELIARKT